MSFWDTAGRIGTAFSTYGQSELANEATEGGVYGGGSTVATDSGPTAEEQAEIDRNAVYASRDNMNSGLRAGRDAAENIYGINQTELGNETQDIMARRRARMDGQSPSSTRLRESRNRRVRMARAGGRSSAEQESIKRQAESDIADTDYAREGQALSSYQQMIGKIIGGSNQMEMGFGGLSVAGESTPQPELGGGVLGSVICTELFKQGYMSKETFIADMAYGTLVRKERPHVYEGYRFLADPVVKVMDKSKLFTYIVSVPALCWARNMEGKKCLTGKVISIVGEFVCGIVGKLIGSQYANVHRA